MPAPIAASSVVASPVGVLLREARARRRLSQLELSFRSGVSARHLSFVETGRSHPSRDVVRVLGVALDLSLREQNALLAAAGYAAMFPEAGLDAPELAPMRRAIDLTLAQQEPFPAFVHDRCWDVLLANAATGRVLGALRPGGPRHANIVRQVFDPDDMRPYVENWEEVAGDLLRHLREHTLRHPGDAAARALLQEVMARSDLPRTLRVQEVGARTLPTMVTTFRRDDLRLSFFSTLTRFAATGDLTLDETCIEAMHPADEETRRFCQVLAAD